MAVQHWTIIKIVGPAGRQVAQNLDAWSALRNTDDPATWYAGQWPPAVRHKASRLLQRLEAHCDQPPIAYYARHVDLWSSAGEIHSLLPKQPPCVMFQQSYLWCHLLPDRGRLLRRARARAANAQFPEDNWLATRIIEAINAYRVLFPQATLLIQRRVISNSPSDEDLLRAAGTMPRWTIPT